MSTDKKPEGVNLAICIPSLGTWDAGFSLSLLHMVLTLQQPYEDAPPVLQSSVHHVVGSILPRSREKLVMQALSKGATHILFLDSDMTFPAWIAHCLLARQRMVIAANCATKKVPSTPTARVKGPTLQGLPVYTHPDVVNESNVVQEVWRVGTGVMLIDARVFKQLAHPWFDTRWEPTLKDHVGEDWVFCEKLEALKIPIYVDHQVSAEIGHVGQMEYDHTLVELPKQEPTPKLVIVGG